MPEFKSLGGNWVPKDRVEPVPTPKPAPKEEAIKKDIEAIETVVKPAPATKSKPKGRPKKGR